MNKSSFKTKLSKKQKRNDVLVLSLVFILSYLGVVLFMFGIGATDDWNLSEGFLLSLFLTFFTLTILIFPIMIIACILGFQRGKSRRVRDNSTFVKVEDLDYYRDNLSELNPALVSTLIDLDFYGKKDVVATLLRLYNKKVISFNKNGSITVLSNSISKLGNDEQELLNLIHTNQLNNKTYLLRWKQNRLLEAEHAGYIQKKSLSNTEKHALKSLYSALLFTLIFMVLWGVYLSLDLFEEFSSVPSVIITFISFLFADTMLFIPWYRAMMYTAYANRNCFMWIRTPLGNEVAEKIAGLNRFINEFSLLSDAKKDEVTLWDDYLVYSIVLEENDKIVDEICKKYNIKTNCS